MNKIISSAFILVNTFVFIGQAIGQGQEPGCNSIESSNLQLGPGALYNEFYANSLYCPSNFSYDNMYLSIAARFFINDKMAIKTGIGWTEWQNGSRINNYSSGSGENTLTIFADARSRNTNITFQIERCIGKGGAKDIKPYIAATGLISESQVLVDIGGKKYQPLPNSTLTIQEHKKYKAVIIGAGATCGAYKVLFNKLVINVDAGLLVGNIHNLTWENDETIYSIHNTNNTSATEITLPGLDKKNIITFGTQVGLHLFYNF